MLATQMAAARGPILAFGAAALGASIVAILGGPGAPSEAAWTARVAFAVAAVALLLVSLVAPARVR